MAAKRGAGRSRAPRRTGQGGPPPPKSREIIVTYIQDPTDPDREQIVVQAPDFDRFAVANRLRVAAAVHERQAQPVFAEPEKPE